MAAEQDRFGALVRDLRPVWARHADGRWYPGLLRRWQSGDGGWWAVVDYHAPPLPGDDPGTTGHRYDFLPADRVRRRDEDWPVGQPGGDD